jgi:hypothetical protein
MSTPKVNDLVYTDHGAGRVERVFYGIITKLMPSRKRFVICTVLLDKPWENKQKHQVKRVEAEIPYQRSKQYDR